MKPTQFILGLDIVLQGLLFITLGTFSLLGLFFAANEHYMGALITLFFLGAVQVVFSLMLTTMLKRGSFYGKYLMLVSIYLLLGFTSVVVAINLDLGQFIFYALIAVAVGMAIYHFIMTAKVYIHTITPPKSFWDLK